jgi:phasin family protein
MSKPAANSFFETDFSKFADMSKMMGEFKMPNMNVEAMMACQRKNMETFAAVNQATFETVQSLMRRQAEWFRQGIEEASALVNAVMTADTPEEKMIKQAEGSKACVEKCLANAREVAETVARSNAQAMETVSNRLSEGLDEFRDIVRSSNGRAAA